MAQKEEKKRDRALIWLLLLLLFITGSVIYFRFRPHNGHRELVVNHPINRKKADKIIQPAVTNVVDSTMLLISDSSGIIVRRLNDTAVMGTPVAADTEAIQVTTTEEPAKVAEPVIEDIESRRSGGKNFINVSADNDINAVFDPVRKNLYFYPTNTEWSNVYLIYPSPDNKSLIRRNLMYPDYEGMIYPQYRKGQVLYNGDNQNVVSVKINAVANKNKSYVIQAKSNPEYFIFGDYADKSRWYIYQNGKVRKFSPPDGFESRITEKL